MAGQQRDTSQRNFGVSKQQLYIHLGTGKTGTSAIQEFLSLNGERLAREHGVLYARTHQMRHNHHQLCTNFQRSGGEELARVRLGLGDLVREGLESDASKVVISSEYFPDVTRDEIAEVYLETLDAHFDVNVIVYFRRQDHYVESWYAQIVKAGSPGFLGSIENLVDRLRRAGLLDFLGLADRWSAFVGDAATHVRPYERGQLRGHNVVEDFVKILGIPDITTYTLSERDANPSLSRDQILLIQAFHQAGLGELMPKKLRVPLPLDQSSGKYLLSPEQRQELVDECRSNTEALARKYLGREDGRFFLEAEPLQSGENWTPLAYPGTEYLIRAVNELMTVRLSSLEAELARLKAEMKLLRTDSSGPASTG